MSTTYLAQSAEDQLAKAQDVIDQHLVACAVCGTHKPCTARTEAEGVFGRYGRLPRRTPGLTRREGQRPSFMWLK